MITFKQIGTALLGILMIALTPVVLAVGLVGACGIGLFKVGDGTLEFLRQEKLLAAKKRTEDRRVHLD